MLLIINADDLGTSERINDEIFALIRSGLVTSATIIANGPAFQHAVERIREFPNCSFGIHLNLTAFAPIGPRDGLDPVLDENGRLSSKLFGMPIPATLRAAILRELTAQARRAFEAGIPVSHFDSHEHVHTIPSLFPVFKSLQRRFGIRRIRSTMSLLPPGRRMTAMRSAKKALFSFALRHVYTTRTPDALGAFRDFHASLKGGRMPRFGSLELMVHPGTSDPLYNEEVELLRSDWRTSLPRDVTLGTYYSL
jgi:chitin disaccharide deacetylase